MDNRDEGLSRNIGKHLHSVFLSPTSLPPVIILRYYLVSVWTVMHSAPLASVSLPLNVKTYLKSGVNLESVSKVRYRDTTQCVI